MREKADWEGIIDCYKRCGAVQETATKMGVCRHTVRRVIDYYKIDRKEYRFKRNNPCKFSEVFPDNDKDLGYICGLIATDGCLSRNFRQISLTQDLKHKYIVEYFSKLTSPAASLYKSRGNSWVCLMTLPKLYQYCLDMGITPNKTHTISVKLDNKSDEFKLYFLRGCIDGDGSIGVRKISDVQTKLSIEIVTASKVFSEQLQALILGSHIYVNKPRNYPDEKIKRKVSLYCVKVCKLKDVKALAKSLPKHDHMHKEKTDKLVAIENFIPPYSFEWKGSFYSSAELIKFLGVNLSCRQVASRRSRGWSTERIFTTPINNHLKSGEINCLKL